LQAGITPKLARRGLNEVRHTGTTVQFDPDRSHEMAYSLSPAGAGCVHLAAQVVAHEVGLADDELVFSVMRVTQ